MVRVLGIETSCDETAAAIVADGRSIASNVVASQDEIHSQTGGVVPETASRLHLRHIRPVISRALEDAGADWSDLDAICVTHGPGLAGCLLVGLNVAKALALSTALPLIGVNHLEGHVYANWLGATADPPLPLVALIVSGGHTDLVLMTAHGRYQRLGHTIDDAAGEAFDKAARMLSLGYPGGPAVQRASESGDPHRYPLGKAWLRGTADFSFSGLKTSLLRTIREAGDGLDVADAAASFQEAIVDVLASKTLQAAQQHGARAIALAGGVAANSALRARISALSAVPVLIPPPRLCTDNAAMIASAGCFRYDEGVRHSLDLDAFPTLPIA
ncbi:MAG: tRNA (adenosine(37)-N6)-threonylcarbamoyltransferase complex transferase subunit TsaD [Chloroflexota bacterium]